MVLQHFIFLIRLSIYPGANWSQLSRNTEILLTKLDKGAGVVILNRADYTGKMNAFFDVTDKFLKLGD